MTVNPFCFSRPLLPDVDGSVCIHKSPEWDNLIVRLQRREWVALFGASGFGKTTTLQWLKANCLLDPTSTICALISLPALEAIPSANPLNAFASNFAATLSKNAAVPDLANFIATSHSTVRTPKD